MRIPNKRLLLHRVESRCRNPPRGAVDTLVADLFVPDPERTYRFPVAFPFEALQEVVLHVFDGRLDLALVLRAFRTAGDTRTAVISQERRVLFLQERFVKVRRCHSRFQVVKLDCPGNAPEILESLDMAVQELGDPLGGHHAVIRIPAVRQHHGEYPYLDRTAVAPEPAEVAEVNLAFPARRAVKRDINLPLFQPFHTPCNAWVGYIHPVLLNQLPGIRTALRPDPWYVDISSS